MSITDGALNRGSGSLLSSSQSSTLKLQKYSLVKDDYSRLSVPALTSLSMFLSVIDSPSQWRLMFYTWWISFLSSDLRTRLHVKISYSVIIAVVKTEGVGARPSSTSTNDAGWNPTRDGLYFISWRPHRLYLELPTCHLWQEAFTKKKIINKNYHVISLKNNNNYKTMNLKEPLRLESGRYY